MDSVLLIARLLLAGVLGVAGFVKLADRPGARQGLIDFGVPPRLASPLGVLLPLAECAVAVALVPATTAWWGAAGALALLLLFLIGISVNLARGRRPDCRCFGQLAARPVGGATLARNVVLAAVAGLLLWQGPAHIDAPALAWLGTLSPSERVALLNGALALGLGMAVLWLLTQLLGQQGRLLVRLDHLEMRLAIGGASGAVAPGGSAPPPAGLPVGAPAPAFRLPGLYGETLTLDALRSSGRPVLLIFADPHCGPCAALLPDLARWQREQASALTLALISRGTPQDNRAKLAVSGLAAVLLQQDREVANAYQAHGTPSAQVVRPDGTIGSVLAAGAEAIRDLVARVTGQPTAGTALVALPGPMVPINGVQGRCPHCGKLHSDGRNGHGAAPAPLPPPAVPVGAPAPVLRLPDLTGALVDLAAFRGRPTVVLFWNPGCGFCQRLLPELRAWEADPPPGAPQLLVVSTGAAEAHQALGLRAPVVLDRDFAVGRAFGASGTPSALLVDARGHIASPVAVGGPAVLALAAAPTYSPRQEAAMET